MGKLPKFGADIKTPSADISSPSLDVNLPKFSGDISTPSLDINLKKPDINMPSLDVKSPELSGDIKIPSADTSSPSLDINLPKPSFNIDVKKPGINVDVKKTDIDVKLPELGFSGPKLAGDSKVPTVDTNLANVSGDVKLDISPPVAAEEKSSKFSFGFGKKGKKKKEKSPQLPTADPVVADLSLPDITLKGKSETSVDVPPPKPPRLDTNLDSDASLLVGGTDIGVDTPSTIISGSEISVSLTDGKVVPNIGSETQIDLPSLSLEKDTDRSLVPKMGLSAKLSKAD